MSHWRNCKRILCVRPDNMGDLLMSSPAIRALKETFGCHITLLTSSMARGISAYIPGVDDVLVWDVPWVKGTSPVSHDGFSRLIKTLKEKQFDAAVIFTVFSQNPLPTALMLTLASIPKRLAYCRENPYHLLTDWVPEPEPYDLIRHQVRRDLDLVQSIGARTSEERIMIRQPQENETRVREKLDTAGLKTSKPWMIFHPGVSEEKRQYPTEGWIEAGKKIAADIGYQLIITGTQAEQSLAENIRDEIGDHAFSLAGELSLEELITLVRLSPLLVSVNTGTVHLAAALQTKTIVLYALTNPQHPPWKTIGEVLPYSVSASRQSRNEILRFVHGKYFDHQSLTVKPDDIVNAVYRILVGKEEHVIPELVLPASRDVQGRRRTLNFHEP